MRPSSRFLLPALFLCLACSDQPPTNYGNGPGPEGASTIVASAGKANFLDVTSPEGIIMQLRKDTVSKPETIRIQQRTPDALSLRLKSSIRASVSIPGLLYRSEPINVAGASRFLFLAEVGINEQAQFAGEGLTFLVPVSLLPVTTLAKNTIPGHTLSPVDIPEESLPNELIPSQALPAAHFALADLSGDSLIAQPGHTDDEADPTVKTQLVRQPKHQEQSTAESTKKPVVTALLFVEHGTGVYRMQCQVEDQLSAAKRLAVTCPMTGAMQHPFFTLAVFTASTGDYYQARVDDLPVAFLPKQIHLGSGRNTPPELTLAAGYLVGASTPNVLLIEAEDAEGDFLSLDFQAPANLVHERHHHRILLRPSQQQLGMTLEVQVTVKDSGNPRLEDHKTITLHVVEREVLANPLDRDLPLSIDSAPSAVVQDSNARFVFSTGRPATFYCRLDAAKFEICTAELLLEGLTAGQHTLAVFAIDKVGVKSSEHLHTWTVDLSFDTTAPSGTVTGPDPSADQTTPDLTLAFDLSDDTGVAAWCARSPFEEDPPAVADACWRRFIPATKLQRGNQVFVLAPGYGEQQVEVFVRDLAGNLTAPFRFTVNYLPPPDTTSPVEGRVVIEDNHTTTYQRQVLLSLSARDDVAVAAWCVRDTLLEPEPEDACWQLVEPPSSNLYLGNIAKELSEGPGLKQVHAWFRDLSGNVSTVASDSILYELPGDVVPPAPLSVELALGVATTASQQIQVSVEASDEVGVTAYCLKEDQNPPTLEHQCWRTLDSAQPLFELADVDFWLSPGYGQKTVTAWFRDLVGNISMPSSDSIEFTGPADSGPPTSAAISINDGGETTDNLLISLDIVAFDDTGITAWCVKETSDLPGPEHPCWRTVNPAVTSLSLAEIPFTLSNNPGEHRLSAWFRDLPGQLSERVEDLITYTPLAGGEDTTPPLVVWLGRPDDPDNQAVFTFTSDDPGATYRCRTDGVGPVSCTSPKDLAALPDGRHTLELQGVDQVGNTSDWLSYSFYLDRTGPVNPAVVSPVGAVPARELTVELSGDDDQAIGAYCLLEDLGSPTPAPACWNPVSPVGTFSLSVDVTLSEPLGTKRLHLWLRDLAGNVSAEAIEEVALIDPFVTNAWLGVPAGSFDMGLDGGRVEQSPAHLVHLSAFHMLTYEVSAEEYEFCVDAGACVAADTGNTCTAGRVGKEDHPINCLSFQAAEAYCHWLGGTLPSEAQWEYAAAGSNSLAYPWGEVFESNRLNYASNGDPYEVEALETTPVGYFTDTTHDGSYTSANGSSPFGLHDLGGNVWEWVLDWYDCYPSNNFCATPGASPFYTASEDMDDPVNLQYVANLKVIRGGSWANDQANLGNTYRNYQTPEFGNELIGLRCVAPAP